ncbi:MAG: hypothetical protein EOM24_16260 [Chloroflexia bacterium]|nr:hypothetical protein [Chloroflexia bacterium]
MLINDLQKKPFDASTPAPARACAVFELHAGRRYAMLLFAPATKTGPVPCWEPMNGRGGLDRSMLERLTPFDLGKTEDAEHVDRLVRKYTRENGPVRLVSKQAILK